jgi:hypothetical protein
MESGDYSIAFGCSMINAPVEYSSKRIGQILE